MAAAGRRGYTQGNQMKTLVVIPTYNESENIETMIRAVFEYIPAHKDVHILVVDDNSPDGTADIVGELTQQSFDKALFLLVRSGKMGMGTAYIDGFKWGLAKGYELFIEMDADLSHHPAYLHEMIDHATRQDVVIGSRYVPGGGIKGWGVARKFISKGGSLYARLILGLPIQDVTGGFNLWKRKVLEKIDLNRVRSEGYAFQIELKYQAFREGFGLYEHPIIFEDRRAGKSKMSKRIIAEAMVRVLQMKISQIRSAIRTG